MADLSIITVVKNNLDGLKKTYESLKSQTNQEFHWLVIDGESTDGTLPWLRGIDRKGFRFESSRDKSLFEAMNKGLAQMETEYCLYLNGGDYFWDASVTDRILKAIKEKHFLVAYGNYMLGGVPGYPDRQRGRRIRTLWQLFYGPVPCHQTMVISRKAFEENGPYREDVGIYGDAEWILRFSKRHHPSTFAYISAIISFYNPEGVSYLSFFKHARMYLRILWVNGNLIEYSAGFIGWIKTAVYVSTSKWIGKNKSSALLSAVA